jgi:hypothetical protein
MKKDFDLEPTIIFQVLEERLERRTLQLVRKARVRSGILVRIRDEEEILIKLDESGCLDGLPFMPEMRQYCGGVFKVLQCVNRILIEGHSVRGFRDVFILEDVRCNGTAHGGCQRLCHFFWKESWLIFPTLENDPSFVASAPSVNQPGIFLEGLTTLPCQGQASVLLRSTRRLDLLNLRQYIQDKQSGTRSFSGTCSMLLMMFLKRTFWGLRKIYRRLFGKRQEVNDRPVLLHPGDLIEVRSKDEIRRTLDQNNKLSGLVFSDAMWRYCRKQFLVLKLVECIIVEETGVFQKVRDTYLLEGVTCDGLAFRGCPRKCYWFWKGAWLKSIESSGPGSEVGESS